MGLSGRVGKREGLPCWPCSTCGGFYFHSLQSDIIASYQRRPKPGGPICAFTLCSIIPFAAMPASGAGLRALITTTTSLRFSLSRSGPLTTGRSCQPRLSHSSAPAGSACSLAVWMITMRAWPGSFNSSLVQLQPAAALARRPLIPLWLRSLGYKWTTL